MEEERVTGRKEMEVILEEGSWTREEGTESLQRREGKKQEWGGQCAGKEGVGPTMKERARSTR
jgi:hypothetical protein